MCESNATLKETKENANPGRDAIPNGKYFERSKGLRNTRYEIVGLCNFTDIAQGPPL